MQRGYYKNKYIVQTLHGNIFDKQSQYFPVFGIKKILAACDRRLFHNFYASMLGKYPFIIETYYVFVDMNLNMLVHAWFIY